jgi:hypothetical protein
VQNLYKNKLYFLVISICVFFGIFIRLYNINYDNLWFDEILSFWVADPTITTQESLTRHQSLEQIPFLFNLILKFIFKIFSYDSLIGRYLSFIFNILGIFFIVKISRLIKKNNAFILSLFLLSSNIYLISYAQELRVYSLILFLCSLNLWFFLSILKKNETLEKINLNFSIIFIFSQILMIISHPFCLIVFFSTSLFSLANYLKFKISIKLINYSILITLLFSVIYFFIYLSKVDTVPGWLEQPGLKFYTNFYFSKFFGSRILGLIHLLILISLIFFFWQDFRKKYFTLNIFLIVLFLSYFLPMLFGYLLKPIIFPRYIIFVLIPIIILLSFLIFEIKNKVTKKILIVFLVTLTIGNHYTETTIQQFIKERPFHKTDFLGAINEINHSNNKYYTLDLAFDPSIKVSASEAVQNYIQKLSSETNITINYIEKDKFIKLEKNEVWTICIVGVMKNRCKYLSNDFNSVILKEKKFTDIILKLIKKIN